MSVNIKNREVEALLAEIKAATRKGTSRIVLELLRKEAQRLRRTLGTDNRRRKVDEITRRYRARLPERPLPAEEIVGYDENGLPA